MITFDKIKGNNFVCVYYDGGNGLCHGGFFHRDELEEEIGDQEILERNEGIYEVGEDGSIFYIEI